MSASWKVVGVWNNLAERGVPRTAVEILYVPFGQVCTWPLHRCKRGSAQGAFSCCKVHIKARYNWSPCVQTSATTVIFLLLMCVHHQVTQEEQINRTSGFKIPSSASPGMKDLFATPSTLCLKGLTEYFVIEIRQYPYYILDKGVYILSTCIRT